jgi:cytochrome c-type biogenesis protein CcmE
MSKTGAKYVQFGLVTAIIVLSLGYLAYTGVQQSKSYYVTISEMRAMGNNAYSKRLRVGGFVKTGSIKRHGTHVEFMLAECEPNSGAACTDDKLIPVKYDGTDAPPDTFKDESQALAEGRYGSDGVFYADGLQAKCASKYAPADAAPKPATGPRAAVPAISQPSGSAQ